MEDQTDLECRPWVDVADDTRHPAHARGSAVHGSSVGVDGAQLSAAFAVAR
jgi:hypothetical protein